MVILQGRSRALAERLNQPGETLHAPHLLDLEIAHAVRREVLRGLITADEGGLAFARLAELSVTRYPHTQFLERIWQLRNNVTAYDAAYVALSEVLDAPLITRDRRLGNAAGHRARIEVF